MKRIKAKYPLKVGDTLIPKGEEGYIMSISESEWVREVFSEIQHNKLSTQCLVSFPSHPIDFICSEKQIEIIEEE